MEAYRDDGEALCANPLHAVAPPFTDTVSRIRPNTVLALVVVGVVETFLRFGRRHARTMRARLASRAHALTWQHTLARQKLDVMLEALATG